MHSPTRKLAFALTLSIAAHSLLLIKGEPFTPQLSHTSIIHARLDKQDRELIQKEQIGQISQQHNEQLSEASTADKELPDQPIVEKITQPKPSVPSPAQDKIVISTSKSDSETTKPPEEVVKEEITEIVETELEELIEETTDTEKIPTQQQENKLSSDSRAQVEAVDGYEDPTYTSYRRILRQYLAQRLEAQPSLKGRVRLKIKLEYGSFATQVIVIESSGDLQLDDWARKAALAANPYPKIPQEIGSTFEFSPTLQLGNNPQ